MTDLSAIDDRLAQAAEAIQSADALLIGGGAGMWVDSGLPDFRSDAGFWKAYPPFRGRSFADLSTPHWFRTDPDLAWGFFGHRLNLYRQAVPHAGFERLLAWARSRPLGAFVFTSNVDGQFQRAGFPDDRILECHGSIHHLQCAAGCHRNIWPADAIRIHVDEATIRARSQPPTCSRCGGIARPNILMFDDYDWLQDRTAVQAHAYSKWLRRTEGRRLVAIELGAGLAIPTVRRECERQAEVLIRINPREPDVAGRGIPMPLGALEALSRIDQLMQ